MLVRVPPGWPPGLAAKPVAILRPSTTTFFGIAMGWEKTEEKALSGHAKGRAPLHLPNADDMTLRKIDRASGASPHA